MIGTARLSWGGVPDALNERIVDQYDLQPFLDAVPHEHLAVGERLMFAPEYRGGPLLFKFVSESLTQFREMGIQLFFGDCEPHLLNSYQSLGYRPYTRRHVNKPETGYLIPIVFVTGDLDYLKSIGSPLEAVLDGDGVDPGVPDGLDQLMADSKSILSYRLDSQGDEWALLQERIREVGFQELSLFSGMSAEEIEACLQKSVRIDCQKGDILIKKGNPAKNLYALIRGNLEVRSGDEIVAVRSPGDIIGEIAFFMGLPRTMDVIAATDDVEVVSFSESALRKLIKTQPDAAARLLFNMSRLLCMKVVGAGR
ncbi:MAG: cyclic nucleotide-binding domain-containing protein [Deltaproteobacteria bacterium]|nr:cyclic nucleotide-binding domain-containing protein [Deltaproteobacteria bacterium]MBW2500022.1 cyclic nucleotide-binding domain-containing protein [Deltaproteobacteria bacterium]